MSLGQRVSTDRQLARLLQIGVVLEEVVEARAYSHLESLSPDERAELDEEIAELLDHAAEESAEHRARLESLVDEMDAETVGYDEIELLVREHYASNQPEDFDGLLYDQLCNEETAYKFYDEHAVRDPRGGKGGRRGSDRDHGGPGMNADRASSIELILDLRGDLE